MSPRSPRVHHSTGSPWLMQPAGNSGDSWAVFIASRLCQKQSIEDLRAVALLKSYVLCQSYQENEISTIGLSCQPCPKIMVSRKMHNYGSNGLQKIHTSDLSVLFQNHRVCICLSITSTHHVSSARAQSSGTKDHHFLQSGSKRPMNFERFWSSTWLTQSLYVPLTVPWLLLMMKTGRSFGTSASRKLQQSLQESWGSWHRNAGTLGLDRSRPSCFLSVLILFGNLLKRPVNSLEEIVQLKIKRWFLMTFVLVSRPTARLCSVTVFKAASVFAANGQACWCKAFREGHNKSQMSKSIKRVAKVGIISIEICFILCSEAELCLPTSSTGQ